MKIPNKPTHNMQRRSPGNNYYKPGIYHITMTVYDRSHQSLGVVMGNIDCPDGHADAPRVELSEIGRMVEYELTHSITAHYPVIEIQDFVIMPEHIHFLAVVKNSIISRNGRETHLGQVLAGFKKGCDRRYWEIIGSPAMPPSPAPRVSASSPAPRVSASSPAPRVSLFPAVSPQGYKVPSSASTGRPPLFSRGYVDVIPLRDGQLETQRAYIRANPRNRLLRMTHATTLKPQRLVTDTLVTPAALRGYLVRERALRYEDQPSWEALLTKLLITDNHVFCDGYGNRQLLDRPLLPVVCHRKDANALPRQKQRCLDEALRGVVLVSARISKGEQEIIDEAIHRGYPVILIADNGFPEIYHPSEQRLTLCATNRLLLLSPWKYQYRHNDEDISVAQCKTMNCFAQALCRQRDDWWKKNSLALTRTLKKRG